MCNLHNATKQTMSNSEPLHRNFEFNSRIAITHVITKDIVYKFTLFSFKTCFKKELTTEETYK